MQDEYSKEKSDSLAEKIAVLKINGAINEATALKTKRAIKMLKRHEEKNPGEIKAVVLRVDSPGGVVTSCETIHQELQDLPHNVVVSFGNVSASGGYYVSTHADRIFASPMSITGSIGVFLIRLNLTKLAKQ